MVIVDVRPDTVGIPTDAYFAVEEIKDVCGLDLESINLINPFSGWNRNEENIFPRPLCYRSRRGRRNWRGTSTP